jgi:hypothetical protein
MIIKFILNRIILFLLIFIGMTIFIKPEKNYIFCGILVFKANLPFKLKKDKLSVNKIE